MASIFTNWCTTQGTNITVYDFRAEVLRSPTAHPHNLQDAGAKTSRRSLQLRRSRAMMIPCHSPLPRSWGTLHVHVAFHIIHSPIQGQPNELFRLAASEYGLFKTSSFEEHVAPTIRLTERHELVPIGSASLIYS
jgi:hypothetical protein